MKILHNTHKLGKESFGIGAVVRPLSIYQAKYPSTAVDVICQDDNDQEINQTREENVGVISLSPSKLSLFGFHPDILARRMESYDIVHQHSMWTPNSLLSMRLKRSGTNIIYTPHGALSKQALSQSNLKKKIAYTIYERSTISMSSAIQALSEKEMQDIREFGIRNPIAVIPNGVDDYTIEYQKKPNGPLKSHHMSNDKRIMLYLSRINPIKGLDLFFEVLSRNNDFKRDWVLFLVGPDGGDYQRELENKAKLLSIENNVCFFGSLYGDEKIDAYDDCEVFVLPSISEGMPMVVLEGLARGKPVLTTYATPIKEIDSLELGVRCETSFNSLRNGLDKIISLNGSDFYDISQRSKIIIREKYNWTSVAAMTSHLYKWTCGEEPEVPEFVHILKKR